MTQQFHHDFVRGMVCNHCDFAVSMPLPDNLGRIRTTLVCYAVDEIEKHIKEHHWLQNIPGTKETK